MFNHGQVADTQEKTQRQQKQRHDRDGTADHKFQVGDLLWLKLPKEGGTNRKLKPLRDHSLCKRRKFV